MRLFFIPFASLRICFNPRICKRCDSVTRRLSKMEIVSIHASVKDATRLIANMIKFGIVSIHASVKDATALALRLRQIMQVSIHASVKDATCLTCRKDKRYSFSPRICKRCDSMFVKSFIDDTFKL